MKMNWGTGITIFMVIYMAGVTGVVIFSFQQDVNLVTEDYYQQELVYEDQITRIKNADALPEKPSVELVKAADAVRLTFPSSIIPEEGTVLFFRPSDFTKDKNYKLALNDNNTQAFDFTDMATGMWKVKLEWELAGKSYYQEFMIVK